MSICETERMLIRSLSLHDLPELSLMLSDPDVMKHSIRGICDEAATRKFIEWCLSCYDSHGFGPWALIDKQDSQLIGFCGIGPERVGSIEEIDLGYRLAKRYWGRGLASESAKAVLDYAFNEKQLDSVVVIIEPENVASIRVAEKVGFSGFENILFHDRPVRLYRMTREE
ncbi:MAG: GNAT family N-acetyltransferase [Chromatiales bacterium]|nr:GNAT family N-acetyltransferase [Chromatiales bacterium]